MSSRAEQRAGTEAAEESERAEGASGRREWPVDQHGDSMVEISFQAHELIGLKDYSNIIVGPARITTLVSRNEPNPFSERQLANIAKGLNDIAEVVEVDVIAEQRGIALGTLEPGKIPS